MSCERTEQMETCLRKTAQILFFIVVPGLFYMALAIRDCRMGRPQDLEHLFLLVFGGVTRTEPSFQLLMVMEKGLPLVCFLYPFSASFLRSMKISAVYVLPRYQKPGRWLAGQSVRLFLMTGASWACVFAGVYVCGKGYSVLGFLDPVFLTTLFLCNWLALFVLSLIQNCASLWMGSLGAFLGAFLACLGSVLLVTNGLLFHVKFAFLRAVVFPVNGQYLSHSGLPVSEAAASGFPGVCISGFPLWESGVTLLLWAAAAFFLTLWGLRCKDYCNKGQE